MSERDSRIPGEWRPQAVAPIAARLSEDPEYRRRTLETFLTCMESSWSTGPLAVVYDVLRSNLPPEWNALTNRELRTLFMAIQGLEAAQGSRSELLVCKELLYEPEEPAYWMERGRQFSQAGKCFDAETCFNRALSITKRHAATWYWRGVNELLLSAGIRSWPRIKRAHEYFEEGLRVDPDEKLRSEFQKRLEYCEKYLETAPEEDHDCPHLEPLTARSDAQSGGLNSSKKILQAVRQSPENQADQDMAFHQIISNAVAWLDLDLKKLLDVYGDLGDAVLASCLEMLLADWPEALRRELFSRITIGELRHSDAGAASQLGPGGNYIIMVNSGLYLVFSYLIAILVRLATPSNDIEESLVLAQKTFRGAVDRYLRGERIPSNDDHLSLGSLGKERTKLLANIVVLGRSFVVAHELGHCLLRHHNETRSKKELEWEADHWGFRRILWCLANQQSDYQMDLAIASTELMIEFLDFLEGNRGGTGHPRAEARISDLRKEFQFHKRYYLFSDTMRSLARQFLE